MSGALKGGRLPLSGVGITGTGIPSPHPEFHGWTEEQIREDAVRRHFEMLERKREDGHVTACRG